MQRKMHFLLLTAASLYTVWASYLTCHCMDSAECNTNGFCASGCSTGWLGPGCQISNVALGKNAVQSSTYGEGGFLNSADRAVDGLIPDNKSAIYCSHTDPDESLDGSAWWYVTLSEEHDYVITEVTLTNRKGGAAELLTNFAILYSNDTDGDQHPNLTTWQECARETQTFVGNRTYTCREKAVAKRLAVYLIYTTAKLLTLCEVQVFGYKIFDCPSGFTGPGCLLRNCDSCNSSGSCTKDYGGSCSYKTCPDRSLLPPECWITLSNYSNVSIKTTSTCNSVQIYIQPTDFVPNIPANLMLLQVSKSGDSGVIVNATLPAVQANSVHHYNYSNAGSNQSFDVTVRPYYCNISNNSCFYGPGSKVFAATTGRRIYSLSSNTSCITVNVGSSINDCEPPLAVQLNCTDQVTGTLAVNTSDFTACGLAAGRQFRCLVIATVDATATGIEVLTAEVETGKETLTLLPSDNTVVIVSGSVAGLVFVAAIVLLVIIYSRKKRNTQAIASLKARNTEKLPSTNSVMQMCDDDQQTYFNISGMTLSQFHLYIQDVQLIIRRFSEVQANEARPCTQGKLPENKGKNRFQNILPYDFNRVILDSAPGGYINASYINGFSKPKEFIATQGPSQKTVEDFWHMMWQEKCTVIIMLTDYIEHGKRKCEKYFPFPKRHAMDIDVTVRSTATYDTHSVTVLDMQHGSEHRLVHHFHFLSWPDQSVPDHMAEVLLFYSRIRHSLAGHKSNSPLIVHCSAGVGRTGVYLAFDYLQQRYQSEEVIDVDRCLLNLRDQRMLLVQTKDQYLFLHRLVLYGLKTSHYIYDAAQLPALSASGTASGRSVSNETTTEWQDLQALVPTPDERSFTAALLPENKHRNRLSHILALDSKRPMIPSPNGGSQLYINAVYCNGCYSNRAFISTQLPLSGTVDDFWLMVYDCQPSCIVLLQDVPDDDKDCPRYWPEPGRSVTTGLMKVECDVDGAENSPSNPTITGFRISVSLATVGATTNQTVSTKLLVTRLWDGKNLSELPTNVNNLLLIANALRTYYVELPKQPIIVQCRDGATHSGLFLAAVNALQRLIETQQVTVFHTVDLLRASRSEFVTSEAQYRYIYKCLETYYRSTNVYANT